MSLSVSDISAEAFLLTSTGVEVLPLLDLDFEKFLGYLKSLKSHGSRSRREGTVVSDDENDQIDVNASHGYTSTSSMDEALQFIWKAIVKPVLSKLQLLRNEHRDDYSLPRIWWVAGGVLSLLPLHAAGHHEPGSRDNTISHVISSYAPTLKVLQFLKRKDEVEVASQKHEILVVSMPTSPGRFDPLDVQNEVDAIKSFAEPQHNVTVLKRPQKSEVIAALQYCTIAHFACHGMANPVDPLKSNLLLGRDTLERLSIQDLGTMVFEKARIIYLSACSTAELKVQSLADEHLHLASQFQLAGFRHVMATSWKTKDRAAVAVAKGFYELLHKITSTGKIGVAEAIQFAVVSL